MSDNLTLSAWAALAIAAAAFGAHLGQSAIDRINPIHFQGPAVHPRDRGAEVSGVAIQPAGARFAELYGWEEGAAARNADCVDCAALGARDQYGGGELRPAAIETGWRAEPHAAYADAGGKPEAAREPTAFEAQWSETERYADFAVEAEPEDYAAFAQ